ncbi:hypothetical protein [Ralstonia insidiosa]|uniref:Type IV pilus biogenesis protein PilP n=1 Tax=Ralstonia insidiosa TaxID=190721 RepID=A0A848P5J3_9RALS|nr:hypothetical protein [Ralstonia insidiosa]NMV39896.1 hypothetical protein [Ralstonia insidiosa]
MRIRDVGLFLLVLPAFAHAIDVAPTDASVDTFGRVLVKQARLVESEMDAKIRANETQASASAGLSGVTPLPGLKQDVNEQEPTVEAIWGLAGKEVAEVNYKGRRIPISMQEPYISKIDGWKLESIKPYEISLVRMHGNRVAQRKTLSLNWSVGEAAQSDVVSRQGTTPVSNPPGALAPGQAMPVVTPPITAGVAAPMAPVPAGRQ